MTYRQQVESHHRQTFADNVQLVAQQMQNPLTAAVTVLPADGEARSVADLIGSVDYIEGEDYSRSNPDNPPDKSRRWLVRPLVIETGQYITKEEKFDQTQDQTSQLLKTHVTALERGKFDRILGVKKQADGSFKAERMGIMGKALEGKGPSSEVAFPTGNYVAADYGDTGTDHGLTAVKLRKATENMELAEFGMETDSQIYGLISPKQKTDLINLALATKTALNPFDVEEIRAGRPGQLLGINWLFTNRLPVDASGNRLIPLWDKANIVCGVWQDVMGDMWNDTNAKNLPYIYGDAYIDATRIQDGGVQIIRCAEA